MRRDINFFSVYSSSYEGDLSDNFNKIAVTILVGCLALILLLFSFFKISDLVVNSQIDAQNSYLQSADTIKARATLAKATAKLETLAKYQQAIGVISLSFAVTPKITSKTLKDIAKMQPADVNVSALTFATGTLNLTCTCKDSASAAIFVHTLDKSGEFANVNYDGVTGSNKGYNISVVITLKGGLQ